MAIPDTCEFKDCKAGALHPWLCEECSKLNSAVKAKAERRQARIRGVNVKPEADR